MATIWGIIGFLLLGGLAGWLAGKLVRGRGFGLFANVLIGVVGALIGGILADRIGVSTGGGLLWEFAIALGGALVLLLVAGIVRRVF